jgi:hypothetical protein
MRLEFYNATESAALVFLKENVPQFTKNNIDCNDL